MTNNQISSDSVALILPEAELQDIRATVELYLRSVGLSVWSDMEAEVFPAEGQCLLIARPRSPLRSRERLRRRPRPKF